MLARSALVKTVIYLEWLLFRSWEFSLKSRSSSCNTSRQKCMAFRSREMKYFGQFRYILVPYLKVHSTVECVVGKFRLARFKSLPNVSTAGVWLYFVFLESELSICYSSCRDPTIACLLHCLALSISMLRTDWCRFWGPAARLLYRSHFALHHYNFLIVGIFLLHGKSHYII
jgi:hypothetical protein